MLRFDPIEEARRNWVEHQWGDGVAMTVATSITRAHQILLASINAALGPRGLTFSRFEVLALLYFARSNALPLGKIGDRLQVHPTSVTSLVNRLVDDGLVVREPHPSDRRTTLARLTERGSEVVLACAEDLEAIDFGVGSLARGEQAEIAAILTGMRHAAGDWALPTSTSTST